MLIDNPNSNVDLLLDFFFFTFLRSKAKKLIVWLNEENKVLKEEGFTVDGKHYKANFKAFLSGWIHVDTI